MNILNKIIRLVKSQLTNEPVVDHEKLYCHSCTGQIRPLVEWEGIAASHLARINGTNWDVISFEEKDELIQEWVRVMKFVEVEDLGKYRGVQYSYIKGVA